VRVARLPNFQFEYWVNGRLEVIRGVGYNARYAAPGRERRAERLQRDFQRMARAGVNTLIGWDPSLFDRELLDIAAANGLGVIMPFHLDPEDDYADPSRRALLYAQIESWVRQYRDHPSVRMWGLGNEVLHKMVRPTWLGGMNDSPEKVARARAFSSFVLDAADRIAVVDPDHPVTYRTAESGYLVWLREAMIEKGRMPENLVLGTNAYTDALRQIVEGWPGLAMNAPLYVSEFGAAGVARGERQVVLKRMWSQIRSRPQWTLGGVVYVWTTDGPEEVDRAFGLVDGNGVEVDGCLLALGEMFRSERPSLE
jgi:beta-galactosidase/beta-glucuronidase